MHLIYFVSDQAMSLAMHPVSGFSVRRFDETEDLAAGLVEPVM